MHVWFFRLFGANPETMIAAAGSSAKCCRCRSVGAMDLLAEKFDESKIDVIRKLLTNWRSIDRSSSKRRITTSFIHISTNQVLIYCS